MSISTTSAMSFFIRCYYRGLDNKRATSFLFIQINTLVSSLLSIWQLNHRGIALSGCGDRSLLEKPMSAFFASRQCPGAAIRAGLDWALKQTKTKNVVISGFHSPLEQSVLKILMTARSPAVMLITRDIKTAKLSAPHRSAVENGHLAIISADRPPAKRRLTSALAEERNEWVATTANVIV